MTTVFYNKKVLITAGPTREPIDPVRYISNHSSGKMGYAIAEQFLQLGAQVILVSGPVQLGLAHPHLKIVAVNTAAEMYLACCRYFETCEIAVFTAAVADYRPARIARQKIKKDDSEFAIHLVKNVDIAAEFGKIKNEKQLSVGFALETNDELAHASAKLERKNFDMVILNSMNDAHAGFGYDTNKITILTNDLKQKQFALKDKKEVAKDIVQEIAGLLLTQQYTTTITT
ncbi:MAG TPA: phosphopantothenoylcysteine decarboxylase [Chitinophagaceae bacterium]|nr:phosphopantothenoylcysteine decarboxylase [Chitinophagaceae bacterium]